MPQDRHTPIVLSEALLVTLIPSGQKMRLEPGETVQITQALGGSVTIQTNSGYLARVDVADFGVLGLDPAEHAHDAGEVVDHTAEFDMDRVIETLKTVFDPEIPINVVDLGLVYECYEAPIDDGGRRIEIRMSMTAPGCGMGDILKEDARERVLALPGVDDVNVELVWDPPWGMERISEVAKLQLGMY